MSKFKYPTKAGLTGKQKQQVKGIVNSQKDMKQFFQFINQTPVSGTSAIQELTLVSKGDDFDERSEDTIQALSCKVNFSVQNAGTQTRQTIRIIIARAKQSPLTVADVPVFNATPNYERLQILYDKVFFMDATEFTTINNFEKKLAFKKKLIPYMKIGYNEVVSGTVSQKNGIYFMSASSEATNGASIQGASSLKFYNTI